MDKNKFQIPFEERLSTINRSIDNILLLSRFSVELREELIRRGMGDKDLEGLLIDFAPENFEKNIQMNVRALTDLYFCTLSEGASVPKCSTPDTYESFIEKYLTPGAVLSKRERFNFLQIYTYSEAEVPKGIKEYIRSMPYDQFLKTPYWKAISDEAKAEHNQCRICGSTEKLEVHHPSYDIHGDELANLSELTVLCHKCHAKYHDKK